MKPTPLPRRHGLERQLVALRPPLIHDHGDVDLGMTASAEEVWEALTLPPLYSLQDHEIHPLSDLNHVFDKTIERMQNVGSG